MFWLHKSILSTMVSSSKTTGTNISSAHLPGMLKARLVNHITKSQHPMRIRTPNQG